MEGVVKFFNRKKGFGFITGDDGNDYFVHFTAIPRGTFINDNDRVAFETAQGERGPKADKIQMIKKAPREERPRRNDEQQGEDQQETAEEQF